MRFAHLILLLIVLLAIPAAGAAEVILSASQGEYYVKTGEVATIPVGIQSTYDHDITGSLDLVLIPSSAGSSGASTSTRTFSAFVESRTVSLPVGRSDTPADYRLNLAFRYPEEGGRVAVLRGIVIHFVTNPEEMSASRKTLTGTDTADPGSASSSGDTSSKESPQERSPDAQLQQNQLNQDTAALKNQMANESRRQRNDEDTLLGYVLADPLITSLDRELKGAGYSPGATEVDPVSNRSGTFQRAYSSGTKSATVTGAVRETRVLFAEEAANAPVPLPEVLSANATYKEYTGRIADQGFFIRETRINLTQAEKALDLTYNNSGNRNLHLKATILGGNVTAVSGENPDSLSAPAVLGLGLASVLLISAGIWYLARHRREERVTSVGSLPETMQSLSAREIACRLLDEAEQDAAQDRIPEAYRKTGRALRVFISNERGSGEELTGAELEQLIGSAAGDPNLIRFILDRTRMVGFAQEMPPAGEFPDLIRSARKILSGMNSRKKSPEP